MSVVYGVIDSYEPESFSDDFRRGISVDLPLIKRATSFSDKLKKTNKKEEPDSPFTFEEYQGGTKETAIYPVIGHGVVYPALGLSNEAGEVLGQIKKAFRDDGLVILKKGEFTEDRLKSIGKELGDVLWYLSQVANELGLSLGDIAMDNIGKLADRKVRGKIKGDGDNR